MSLDLDQVDLVSADPEATLEFYRELGVDIPDEAIWRTETGIHHIDVTLPSRVIFPIDSVALADHYDTGWKGNRPTGPSIIVNFKVDDRSQQQPLRTCDPAKQPTALIAEAVIGHRSTGPSHEISTFRVLGDDAPSQARSFSRSHARSGTMCTAARSGTRDESRVRRQRAPHKSLRPALEPAGCSRPTHASRPLDDPPSRA